MKRTFSCVLAILFGVRTLLGTGLGTGHVAEGTRYESEAVNAYALHRHGLDGALFLDPYFLPDLVDLEGLRVLDAGCRAAPWAILAAQNGAEVFGIDLQEKMIEKGLAAVLAAGMEEKVHLQVGDVAYLPFSCCFFDRALSINVGCNLPSTHSKEGRRFGLGPHVDEIARVIHSGGKAVVTAPASFGIVFTNGSEAGKIASHIQEVLAKLEPGSSPSEIASSLSELTEVYRATFAFRDGKLQLIENEADLMPGEEIWRKVPGLAIPNRYHSESEYLAAFSEANLQVDSIEHPFFSSEEERAAYNGSCPNDSLLCPEYASHPAFVIFHASKP